MRGAGRNRKETGSICVKKENDQQARIRRQNRKRPLEQERNSRANDWNSTRNSKETRQLTTGQYKRRTRGRKRKAHKVIQQIKSMYWEVAILQLKR